MLLFPHRQDFLAVEVAVIWNDIVASLMSSVVFRRLGDYWASCEWLGLMFGLILTHDDQMIHAADRW